MLLLQAGWASTLTALGVPGAGGALADPIEAGTLGLVWGPAAAWSESREVLLDVAAFRSAYRFKLDGTESVTSEGIAAVPFLAATFPIGRFAIGAHVYAPFARGGESPADGPQRYHTIAGDTLVVEGDLSLAARVVAEAGPAHWNVIVGAGGRVVRVGQASSRSFDTGALLYALLGEDSGVPLQDPFLEGTQTLEGLVGWGVGVAGGLRVASDFGGMVVGARSPVQTDPEGQVLLVPSNDLAMVVTGDLVTHVRLPGEATIAVWGTVGRVTIHGDAGWIGWSSLQDVGANVSNLTITSPDDAMQAILEGYGIDEATFLDGLGETVTTTGMRDVWTGGAGIQVDVADGWIVRAKVSTSPAAIPDPNVHPGNVDFSSVDTLLAARWEATRNVSLGLGLDVYFGQPRHIEDSGLSLTNDPATGMVFPSGNGDYWLQAGRVGATVLLRL